MSTFEFWIELAWLGAQCKGKTLSVTVQYLCSVFKAKHDQVFSAALLNGRKIQISLQQRDRDLTLRVTSATQLALVDYGASKICQLQIDVKMVRIDFNFIEIHNLFFLCINLKFPFTK